MSRRPGVLLLSAVAIVILAGGARQRAVTPGRELVLDARRSFIVTDQAILDAFPFERVMNALLARSGTQTTAVRLYQQLFDTQNPRPGLVARDAPHCDDFTVDARPAFNGLPRRCPTPEGALANSDPFARGDHIPLALLPVPAMREGSRLVKMSPDQRQALCYQCHAPSQGFLQAQSGDDRTPVGVHEGISCLVCHQNHGQQTRASCATCHPKMSNCGLDVEKMDTTFKIRTSAHNIHSVKCLDCHSIRKPGFAAGLPKEETCMGCHVTIKTGSPGSSSGTGKRSMRLPSPWSSTATWIARTSRRSTKRSRIS